jgi:succinyl-CoA synthetase beta subunit
VDLYEHEGKELLTAAGVLVPPSRLVRNREEAERMAADCSFPLVVKAQVLSGGRGKAGGVRVLDDPTDLSQVTDEILRLHIKGRPVAAVLLEQAVEIDHEYYLSVVLDRHRRCPLLIFAGQGGVDIEEVARADPGAVMRLPIDPLLGLRDYQIRRLCLSTGLPAEERRSLAEAVHGVWRAYCESDATLVEVNPLALARWPAGESDRSFIALDAKVTVDDNALFRHPQLDGRVAGTDERERRARREGFAYVSLDGEIGVLGNGAGLVMGLLDQVHSAGGRPANFLDIGGGADASRIATALQIVLSDARIKVLLVSIFGGITRCDEVARGLLEALITSRTTLPVVVALAGTNASSARDVLRAEAPAGLSVAADAEQAVVAAVDLAGRSPVRLTPDPSRGAV